MFTAIFNDEDLIGLVEELHEQLPFEDGEAQILIGVFQWLEINFEEWPLLVPNMDQDKAKAVILAIYGNEGNT